MKVPPHLPLFTGFGVELEYMLVDAESLDVLPVSDELLKAVAGAYESEIEMGELAWSNELALHVLEFKTNGPKPALDGLASLFQADVEKAHELLAPLGGRMMPGAMHPWMDPHTETRLWTHEYNPVYEAFDRIFDCRGHGWSNLQSVHLNLPFADDAEFARLHAAIRLLLPILPALAASSPIADGRVTGFLDTRLHHYRRNARRIPSVTGHVIPEPVYSRLAYEREILDPIYADLAPHDLEGILRFEWANARGAIARFDRNTIEIRVIDAQECPLADLAITAAATAVLRALTEERWTGLEDQQRWPVAPLDTILRATTRDADRSLIEDPDYLRMFGYPDPAPCRAVDLWRYLAEELLSKKPAVEWRPALDVLLDHGPLARRLLAAAGHPSVGTTLDRPRLATIYGELSTCLATGSVFESRP